MKKARCPINLDRVGYERLESLICGMEYHPRRYALELFPDRPPKYVKAAHLMALYASELLTARRYKAQGHIEDARKVRERCLAIYEKLPDYAKW
jgi:hypothetical protein